MLTIKLVLLILAFLCFVLSTFGVGARVNLQSAGLAFWILALLVT